MTATITVRAADGGDDSAVRALLRAASLPEDVGPAWFPRDTVVATDGARIIGAAAFERAGDDALLRSVVVAPGHRGHGLGERLTRDRLAAMRRAGLRGAYLLTTDAAAFFERLGFAAVERTGVPAPLQALGQFASLCPASARCLHLPLAR